MEVEDTLETDEWTEIQKEINASKEIPEETSSIEMDDVTKEGETKEKKNKRKKRKESYF